MKHERIPYYLKIPFDCGDHMWEISLEELYQAFKERITREQEEDVKKFFIKWEEEKDG